MHQMLGLLQRGILLSFCFSFAANMIHICVYNTENVSMTDIRALITHSTRINRDDFCKLLMSWSKMRYKLITSTISLSWLKVRLLRHILFTTLIFPASLLIRRPICKPAHPTSMTQSMWPSCIAATNTRQSHILRIWISFKSSQKHNTVSTGFLLGLF